MPDATVPTVSEPTVSELLARVIAAEKAQAEANALIAEQASRLAAQDVFLKSNGIGRDANIKLTPEEIATKSKRMTRVPQIGRNLNAKNKR